jgi:7-carboxy-7-deazaguanine synthase (Cx14CxxC type)
MAYTVKEVYYTIQGEGAQTGRPAVFLRFSGCNLWSGREQDRAAAVCNFCDTDFLGIDGPGGGKFESAADLAAVVQANWPCDHAGQPLVVCTGGEPLLQLDDDLIAALHAGGFEVAVETNGTVTAPMGIDWLCVSPKADTELVITSGDELKLVHPQPGVDPAIFLSLDFRHYFLQPMDGPDLERNQHLVGQYCLAHPPWRVSLQTHKILGLP